MTLEGGTSYATADLGGGYSVTSNGESADAITDNLTEPQEGQSEEITDSEAASKLGKKGGEASAKAREERKAEEDAEAKAAEKKANPRHDAKARMLEATSKEATAKRERDEATAALAREREERAQERAELARRLEALERRQTAPAGQQEQRQAPPAQGQDDDPEPQPNDFTNYEDYVRKQARWEARQEFKELQKKTQERTRAEQFFAEKRRAHGERLTAFQTAVKSLPESERAELRQFAEGLQPSHQVHPSQHTAATDAAEYIFRSGSAAPLLMRYFIDHPEEHARITALPDGESVYDEMAMIRGRLTAQPAKPAAPRLAVSNAKPPIRPLAGSAASVDDDDDSEPATYEAHKAREEARERKARAR